MKPPPFAYHAPTSVDEALDLLGDLGDEAKVLAGGQSLIPLLNMRLASPANLVDINRITALDRIDVDEGGVTVGACARHAAVERHEEAYRAVPLLRQALRLVAHPVIRNRGTTCGSIAHADPAGELTAVLAVLGGTVRVERRGGDTRDVTTDDFFVAPLESSLRPGDLVTSVHFPRQHLTGGSAFVEIARRHGDYALCGVGATVSLDADGSITDARVGAISIHPTPLVVDCGGQLAGRTVDDAALEAAAELVDAASEPEADLHATVAYRRQLTRVMTARAIRAAAAHARRRAAAPAGEDRHG
ncbi:MAG TPA: xanthine dehydrogenase family protein subunit M [Euzebyales bacterium]|nr:xanthine dehydrogenase family protein subunit M [Euzebyales bacterium]